MAILTCKSCTHCQVDIYGCWCDRRYTDKGYIEVTPDTPACDLRFRRVKYVKKPNGTIGIEEIRK